MSQVQFQPIRQDVAIAYRHDGAKDRKNGPTGLFWLGGFMSDMEGSKAAVLADLAKQENRPCLRFDYSGHGQSGGEFRGGTISKWLDESVAIFTDQTTGPRIIIGSSMGGWLALLLYRHFQQNAPEIAARIKGLVLIAPAADMTQRLMWDKYGKTARSEIIENGFYAEPSDYGDEPYIITRDLIEDGKQHCLMHAAIKVSCPVRILQGEQDIDVPWQHAFEIYQALEGDNVAFTLVKSGDHRLSTPRDLATLKQTCQQLMTISEKVSDS